MFHYINLVKIKPKLTKKDQKRPKSLSHPDCEAKLKYANIRRMDLMGKFDDILYANPIQFMDSFFASPAAVRDYCTLETPGDLDFPWKCGLAMKKFVKKNAVEILLGESKKANGPSLNIKKDSPDYYKVLVSTAFYMNDFLEHSIHPAWYIAYHLHKYKKMNPDPNEVGSDIELQRELILDDTLVAEPKYQPELTMDNKLRFARQVLGAGCLDSKIVKLTPEDILLAADFFEEFSEDTNSRGSWYLGSRVEMEDAAGINRFTYYALDNYITVIRKFKNDLESMSADELTELICNLKKPEYYVLDDGEILQNKSLKDGSIIHNNALATITFQ